MSDGDRFDAAYFRLRDTLRIDEKLSRSILRGLADLMRENFIPDGAHFVEEIASAAFTDDADTNDSSDCEDSIFCGCQCGKCPRSGST